MSEIGVPKDRFQNYNNIISAKFGEKCKTIGENAFGSSTIERFNDDNNIITIGTNAFSKCSKLKSIFLPKCEIIGTNAFEFCTQISSASYDNIINIGERAFIGCIGLTEIKIPKSVNTIGKRAFVGCESIGTIIVDSENDFFDSRTNCNAIIETSSKTLIAGCQTTTIPESVINIGNNAFESITTLASITIPDSIKSIGDNAFYRCTNLESIEIPINIISIGGDAFEGCSKLTHVKFNAENCSEMGSKEYPAFKNCTNLSSVTIGTSVVNIPPYAFYGCSEIDIIEIPKNVESIGTSAFEGCNVETIYNFSDLIFEQGSPNHGHIAENKTATIYNFSGGSNINNYLFDEIDGKYILVKYIGNDKELELPDSYNGNNYAIGANVFDGNTTITSVKIPNSVTSIGDYAFRRCSGLKSIEIPNSVTSIGKYAFYECNFEELNIPQSVETIGVKAFVGCRKIYKITVDQNNSHYYVDDNAIIERNTNTLIFGCKSTKEISVENIGSFAFEGCSGLENIKILNGVKKIGDAAFYNCSGLKSKSIEIPKTITEIGGHAFYNCNITNVTFNATECTSMGKYMDLSDITKKQPAFKNVDKDGNISYPVSSVTIGNSVKNIPAYAFYNCSQITSIDIPNTVESIGTSAFEGCTGIKTVKNYSISFKLEKGKDTHGYVACYADNVYNYFTINNFNFINENGVNRLVEYTGSDENINLPIISLNNYNGEKYTIGSDVFKNNTTITTITIPNRVKSIGDNAFEGCTNLKTIINYSYITITKGKYGLGDNIVKIINAPDGFVYQDTMILFFNESGGITFANYFGEANKYTIPEKYGDTNITSIGDYAFVGNRSIQTIEIPDSITSIGNYAFKDVGGIYTIIIGNSVSSIGPSAFEGCDIKTIYNFSDLKFEQGSPNHGHIAENAETLYNYSGGSKVGDYLFDEIDDKYILMNYVGYGSNLYLPNNCKGESYDIGNNVFRNNTTITSVEIPSDVSNIGNYAFSGCSGLTSVEIPSGVTSIGNYAFSGCSGLTSVEIPNNEVNIGDWAFSGCSGLNSVTIPTNVKNIGGSAFDGCSSLKNVNYNAVNCKTITVASNAIFNNCLSLTDITIGENVNLIPTYLFNNCTNLTNITIPNSVTSIEYGAFFNCKSLTSIEIPNSVTNIGDYIFHGCSKLTNVTLPDSITTISWYMFYNCTNLTHITIPNNVKSIGQYSFSGCNKLASIVIGKNVVSTSIGTNAFAQIINNVTTYCPIKTIFNCSNIKLEKNSTKHGGIAKNAETIYGNHTNMTTNDNKYIGASIIDDYLFNIIDEDIKLIKYFGQKETIILPENYDGKEYIIGMSSFTNNTNIINVTIPNCVTKIEQLSFAICSKLQNIYLNNTTPPVIENNVFLTTSNNNNFKIYVPKGSGNIYKENWTAYSNYIVEQQ